MSGRGEPFKAGGRVVKNVTGFDLSKLIAGSFGTLAALTELTVRALPAPEETRTVVVLGLSDAAGVRAMTTALSGRSMCLRRGAPAGGGRRGSSVRAIASPEHRRRCCGSRHGSSVSYRAAELRATCGDGVADDAGYPGKHERLARGARRRLLHRAP